MWGVCYNLSPYISDQQCSFFWLTSKIWVLLRMLEGGIRCFLGIAYKPNKCRKDITQALCSRTLYNQESYKLQRLNKKKEIKNQNLIGGQSTSSMLSLDKDLQPTKVLWPRNTLPYDTTTGPSWVVSLIVYSMSGASWTNSSPFTDAMHSIKKNTRKIRGEKKKRGFCYPSFFIPLFFRIRKIHK